MSDGNSPVALVRRARVLQAVVYERSRQEQLRREGKLPFTCADGDLAMETKLPPLGEEFGEVCRAVCELDERQLKVELTQLAAVAVAWLESLEPLNEEGAAR